MFPSQARSVLEPISNVRTGGNKSVSFFPISVLLFSWNELISSYPTSSGQSSWFSCCYLCLCPPSSETLSSWRPSQASNPSWSTWRPATTGAPRRRWSRRTRTGREEAQATHKKLRTWLPSRWGKDPWIYCTTRLRKLFHHFRALHFSSKFYFITDCIF